MKVGLISNPLSRANRKTGGLAAQVEPAEDICTARPRDPAQLRDALVGFARQQVALVAIDGGDGTVRDVVNSLHHAYRDRWPILAILPSGKTNVIAGEVGHFQPGPRGWQRLMAMRAAGTLGRTLTERAALELTWPGRPDPVQRGFLIGCAAFAEGKYLAEEKLHPMGIARGLAVALAIGSVLRRNLLGGRNRSGTVGTLCVDGMPRQVERHFLILASTLDRLTLGLRPFWDRGTGAINWLDISAPPKRLLSGAVLMARGQCRPWMEQGGYASGRAGRLDIRIEGPFVLDGELYEPHGHVRVSSSQPIRFASP